MYVMVMMMMYFTLAMMPATTTTTTTTPIRIRQAHWRLEEAFVRRVVIGKALLRIGIIVHVLLLGVALIVFGM